MMTPEEDRAFRELVGEAIHPHAHRRLNLAELVALAGIATPWRCHGIAADGYLTVLAGRGGEGKSMLSLGLAAGVLTGRSVAGIDCEPGTVAVFDSENGPKLIGKRVKAIGLPHSDVAIYDADGLDLAADYLWIEEQLQGVNFAVFDSLRTLAPGCKENDADDMAPRMTALRRLARKTDAACILIHHRGKDTERDFRGSEVIRDLTDLMFVLERDAKDPDRQRRRSLRCVKCRIDEEPSARWLGIRHYRGEVAFTEAAPFTVERTSPRRDEVQVDILNLLKRDGASKRADVARKLGREPSDRTVRRAFEQLKEDGRVEPVGDLWRVVTSADDKVTSHEVVSLSGCRPKGRLCQVTSAEGGAEV